MSVDGLSQAFLAAGAGPLRNAHAGQHPAQALAPAVAARTELSRNSSVGGSYLPGAGSVAALLLFSTGSLAARAAGRRRARKRQTRHPRSSPVVVASVDTEAAVQTTPIPAIDRSTTKAFRRNLMSSDKYVRLSKTQMEEAMTDLKNRSGSELLREIRENGFRMTIGDVTFVLAESYGFCWGVERTLAMAYEADKFFPDKTIWLTNEIIHNAVVNRDLAAAGMRFIPKAADGGKDFSGVQEGDVVILPAFGASVDEMAFLKERNVNIVDTTCPWVSRVWNTIEKSKDKGHTAIIHGKYAHEETVATKSFADKYIVVKDMKQAEYVANYILGHGNREEFMDKFRNAMSDNFDPDVDLYRVGVANQTTMLKGETELIGRLFERVMIKRYGPQEINKHFVAFNTICDATQERQDAIYKMMGAAYEAPTSELYAELEGEQVGVKVTTGARKKNVSSKAQEAAMKGKGKLSPEATPGADGVDLCLVIGGFNSSNTTHLIEIPEDLGVTTYHIDCADRIDVKEGSIEHKPLSTTPQQAMLEQGLEVTKNFMRPGPLVIGVTAGASTPDSSVGDCLAKILEIRGISV